MLRKVWDSWRLVREENSAGGDGGGIQNCKAKLGIKVQTKRPTNKTDQICNEYYNNE